MCTDIRKKGYFDDRTYEDRGIVVFIKRPSYYYYEVIIKKILRKNKEICIRVVLNLYIYYNAVSIKIHNKRY